MYKKIIMAVVLIAYGTDTFTQHLDDSRGLFNASKYWRNQSQFANAHDGWKEIFYVNGRYDKNLFDAAKNDPSGLGLFSKDKHGRSMVMSGVQGGFTEMLNSALEWAVEKNKLMAVLDERNQDGDTPFMVAIASRDLRAATLIVKYAKEHNMLERIMTVQNNEQVNCLMKAIAAKNPPVLDLLYHEAEGNGFLKTLILQKDARQDTAFYWCATNAGQHALPELVEYADRLNIQKSRLFDYNKEDVTCLMGAMMSKDKDNAVYILDRLKSSNLTEDERAVYLNRYDHSKRRTALQWLMRMTEGSKVKSDSLATPFKVNDTLAITKSILSNNGVDVLKQDSKDHSVVYWAQCLGLTDIVECLRSYLEAEYPDDAGKQRRYNKDIAFANRHLMHQSQELKRRKIELDEERN